MTSTMRECLRWSAGIMALCGAGASLAQAAQTTRMAPAELAKMQPPPIVNDVVAVDLARGTSIIDATGAAAARVVGVEGQFVTVTTGKNQVRLPLNALHKTSGGITFGMSAAQLDAILAKGTRMFTAATGPKGPPASEIIPGAPTSAH